MSFKIGTTAEGVALLSALTPALPNPQHYYHDAEERVELLNGHDRWQGEPWTEWRWPQLTIAQFGAVCGYCSGASAAVYIATPNKVGTFADYQAIMRWPDPASSQVRMAAGFVFDVQVILSHMIELDEIC